MDINNSQVAVLKRPMSAFDMSNIKLADVSEADGKFDLETLDTLSEKEAVNKILKKIAYDIVRQLIMFAMDRMKENSKLM